MEYSAGQIAQIVGGRISGPGGTVNRILTDSRKIVQSSHALFVAIPGEYHDGHKYIKDVYLAGVRHFLVEKTVVNESFSDACFIMVENCIDALQKLAAYHRSQFNIPVIGITGSNGKTIVKEWLNLMLADDYVIARSPRSYNSQIGVPISVLNLEEVHTFGIFEAGISEPGEMKRLAGIINPTIGIITNLGTAHLENFSDRSELAREKLEFFTQADCIVYGADYAEINKILNTEKFDRAEKISWSYDDSAADFWIRERVSSSRLTEVYASWRGEKMHFSFALGDDASAENAVTCIVTMLVLGFSVHEIQERLDRLQPLEMRLELVEGINDCTLVNDVYSNDLHSLEIALDFTRSNSQQRKQVVILSDIVQSGLAQEVLWKRVNELLISKKTSELIGIGPAICEASNSFTLPHTCYKTVADFLSNHRPDDFRNVIILVKGARHFRFEVITEWLQEKTHDTIMEVNLASLSHNLNYFRSLLDPSTRLMVMVKAFGYGSGAHEIASLLEFNKVDYLAVAYTDEGVALRKAGISLPVMVMNPEKASLSSLIHHKLEPEIYSRRTLNNFIDALARAGVTEPYPVHVKLDTGMHRLGFGKDEWHRLGQELAQNPALRIASVFTHLAATDEAGHDNFTEQQISLFNDGYEQITSSLDKQNDRPFRHVLNTGGIQRFSDAQYEMVRLGIGLYGVSAHAAEQKELKTVSTLKTIISQKRKISKGESVGYSRKFTAPGEMTIATIPLGYADGLRRTLSNGVGHVIIHGKKAPIVGNVCMDMTMVDVTHITCSEGDAVEIFGPNLTLNQMAEMSGTIAYEVLTSVSQRVKRVYIQE